MSSIIPFDNLGTGKLVAPNYLSDLFSDSSNIERAESTPRLSIKGKNFRIIIDGEETLLTRMNKETGDNEPISSVKAIILSQGPRGSRSYYDKKYDGESAEGPACYSIDGKVPAANAPTPQAKTCAECPHSVKGSKVTDTGHVTTACALQRRLAVIPATDTGFTALLLRLAGTSAWDKEDKGGNQKAGWFAWQQYLDFLTARGVRHTAQVVTTIKFDTTEYPKLLFRAERFLTEEEARAVAPRIKSEEVTNLLLGGEEDFGGSSIPAAVAPAAKTAEAEQEDTPDPVVEPKPKAKPALNPVTKPDPVVEDEAPAAPAHEKSGAVIADILSAWDD